MAEVIAVFYFMYLNRVVYVLTLQYVFIHKNIIITFSFSLPPKKQVINVKIHILRSG